MPRKAANQTNKPLAIFATLLIVAGVVAVVAVSNEFKNATTPPGQSNATNASSTAISGPYASGTVVLVNENAVTLVRLDATSERVTPDQFTTRFAGEQLPVEGSDVSNGTKAYFQFPGASSTAAIESPDAKATAELVDGKNGTSAINFTQGTEAPQSVVLRDGQGHALQNATLLGWLDANSVAVAGVPTSTGMAYRVRTDGSMTQIASFPPGLVWTDVRGGVIWYATAVMGEGIESTPKGPSELHRISSDGSDMMVARDELHVFLTALQGSDDLVAATTDDGQSFILKAGDPNTRVALGKERPLFFLPDGTLLVRDAYDISVYDPTTKVTRKIASVPEGQVTAFFLP